MLPDFPAFPSIALDGGRARLYRVHGPTSCLVVSITAPKIGNVMLFAFCEGRQLAAKAFVAREPGEFLYAMQLYRAGADPLDRERYDRPSIEEAPDIRPLYERGYAYGIDASEFAKPGGGRVVPFPEA